MKALLNLIKTLFSTKNKLNRLHNDAPSIEAVVDELLERYYYKHNLATTVHRFITLVDIANSSKFYGGYMIVNNFCNKEVEQ